MGVACNRSGSRLQRLVGSCTCYGCQLSSSKVQEQARQPHLQRRPTKGCRPMQLQPPPPRKCGASRQRAATRWGCRASNGLRWPHLSRLLAAERRESADRNRPGRPHRYRVDSARWAAGADTFSAARRREGEASAAGVAGRHLLLGCDVVGSSPATTGS